MLETLDLIDWVSLEHEHRSAVDDPTWIRDLASDDAESRKQARIQLWGRSNHFPAVDAVTPHTVPFLLELLKSAIVRDKPQLVVYLGALAWGKIATTSNRRSSRCRPPKMRWRSSSGRLDRDWETDHAQ